MTATVEIDRIAAGGDGVGRMSDGLVVFVPRTAPGDKAEVELLTRNRSFARARLLGLASEGPDRVEPTCSHYRVDNCGGCQLQHLSPAAQLEVKRALVGDALRRIGHRDVADPSIISASEPWRYRSKITLSVSNGHLGLHVQNRPDRIFDLKDCLIAGARIMELWAELRKHVRLFPSGMTGLVLREDREGGLHVVCLGGEAVWNANDLVAALPDPAVSIWWQPERGVPRVVAGRQTTFPAVAFEQVNMELAARVRSEAVDGLGEIRGSAVWDLYSGVGDAGESLADAGARVWCVDSDRSAVRWGKRRHRTGSDVPRLGSLTRICGRVEDELARLPEPEAVVVNPPRTGMHRSVSQKLERWAGAKRGRLLSYVSCDPATLARDLNRMPSLEIRSVRAYDLFPQTSHVETLVVLESK